MTWQKVKLSDIGSISRGRSKHRPRNAPELYGGEYPFIQTADVKNADLYLTTYTQTYNETGLAQSKLWSKGTMCITIAANIADTCILGIDACFPDSIIGFVPDDQKCDIKYVKYKFDFDVQRQYQQMSQGATQDNLSQEKLLSFQFEIPTLDIQKKVAGILAAYDDLIENNRRRIALLEKMASELYRERFVREGGCLDEVGLMECSFISFCTSRIKKYDGTKRYLATADVDGRSIVGHGELLQYDELPSRAQMLPELYSVWFARMSASYKILAFSDSNADLIGELILSSGFAGFKSDKEHWPYVRSFFSSEWFNSEKDRFATGATQISITNDGLTRIKIPVPQEKDVVEYARLVNPIFCEVDLLKKQSANLARQRDRLLPRLMSGKIDLDKLVKGEEVENG